MVVPSNIRSLKTSSSRTRRTINDTHSCKLGHGYILKWLSDVDSIIIDSRVEGLRVRVSRNIKPKGKEQPTIAEIKLM